MTHDDLQRWRAALPAALEQPAREHLTEDEQVLRKLLEDISLLYMRPDDWSVPYGPMFAGPEGRSKMPEDLTDFELSMLGEVVDDLPQRALRIRVIDILAFRATGRERAEGYRELVAAVTEGIADVELDTEAMHQFDRAILVALRFRGAVQEEGMRLVQGLVDRLLAPRQEFEPIWIADVLMKHGVARELAGVIAPHLRALSETADRGVGRSFREAAAAWSRSAGARDDHFDDIQWVVDNLRQEAAELLSDGKPDAALRASADLENALKLLRTIPKTERAARGLGDVSDRITADITAANVRALTMLRAVRSDPIDLTEVRKQAGDAVARLPMFEAIYTFLRLEGVAEYEVIKATAEEALEGSPVSRFVPTVHFAADARVTAHTNSENDLVYGVPANLWQQMMKIYQRRVGLSAVGLIIPAWITLSNEHHLGVGSFLELTKGSPLVPPDRVHVTAQALYYGYDGDFLTAAQLLAPQVENLVRVQLANAGVQTRQFEDGTQAEIGLSGLMDREDIADILGPDVAFEIRALFCSPVGPNLRNAYAHGLVGDSARGSSTAIYAWWLVWKLIDWDFSNHVHDVAAAEAREPDATHENDAEDDIEGERAPDESGSGAARTTS